MALDEPTKNEKPVQVNGVEVLIDGPARSLTDKTVIDYVDEPSRSGFLFEGAGSC